MLIRSIAPRLAAGCLALFASLGRADGATTLSVLTGFGATGFAPTGELLLGADGYLYGTTTRTLSGGTGGYGGTLFRLSRGGELTTLASFGGTAGTAPNCKLVADAAGNLYGTTSAGASGYGAIFKYVASTGTLTTLGTFTGANGSRAQGALALDAAGNLYGTTVAGGATNNGTVFKLSAAGALTTLHTFDANVSGNAPYAGVRLDAASGKLIGTTYNGAPGQYGGSIYSVDPTTGAHATLAGLTGAYGANLYANVAPASDGSLWGASYFGGYYNQGTIFRRAAGGTMTFVNVSPAVRDATSAIGPHGTPLVDAVGNVFGTTTVGGESGNGTVWRVDAATRTFTILASLPESIGSRPEAGLIADANGVLYGVAPSGGPGPYAGSVFKIEGSGFVVVAPEPAALAAVAGAAVVGLRRRRRR